MNHEGYEEYEKCIAGVIISGRYVLFASICVYSRPVHCIASALVFVPLEDHVFSIGKRSIASLVKFGS